MFHVFREICIPYSRFSRVCYTLLLGLRLPSKKLTLFEVGGAVAVAAKKEVHLLSIRGHALFKVMSVLRVLCAAEAATPECAATERASRAVWGGAPRPALHL